MLFWSGRGLYWFVEYRVYRAVVPHHLTSVPLVRACKQSFYREEVELQLNTDSRGLKLLGALWA